MPSSSSANIAIQTNIRVESPSQENRLPKGGGGTLVLLAFLANLNFALGSWGEGTFLHYDYILQ